MAGHLYDWPMHRKIFAGILALGLAALANAAGAQAGCDDEELSEVAALLLLEARSGVPDERTIARALREAGSSLPSAKVLSVGLDDEEEARAWIAAQGSPDGLGVCGEASASRRLIVFGVRAGQLRREGDSLRVSWSSEFRDAYLVLIRRGGETSAHAVPHPMRIEVPSDLVRAQLVATGPAGPRPLADWGNAMLPPLPAGASEGQRLERLRRAVGVSPMRRNRLLDQAAARHATRVCREHRARHVFDTWPAERMRQLGLRARHLGEAVARARTVSGALEALAQSPSHRMALVDRRFTDVGFGVVRRRGESCVVVFLAAWPQAIGG